MIENLNRAFLYGESVFTTLRISDGSPLDWEHHFERLRRGVEFVFGPFIEQEGWVAILKNRLEACCVSETGDKIVRLTVYRDNGRGLFRTSMISITDLKIHFSSTPSDPTWAQGRMLKLRTCNAVHRPHWWPSYLKSGNYLETILAQKMFLLPQDDDLLFLSNEGHVLASSVANIFVVYRNKLYTAPLGPNVLEGVMRRKVLEVACEFFEDCQQLASNMEQLKKAEAVFGTNSVRGPFIVSSVDDHGFVYSAEFLEKFEKLKNRVTE